MALTAPDITKKTSGRLVSPTARSTAARFFASGKIKEMSDTVHTSILFAAISGVVMMIVGLLFSRFALELMKTPDEVIDMAALYFKIYFVGVPFFMLYNYGAAVFLLIFLYKNAFLCLLSITHFP